MPPRYIKACLSYRGGESSPVLELVEGAFDDVAVLLPEADSVAGPAAHATTWSPPATARTPRGGLARARRLARRHPPRCGTAWRGLGILRGPRPCRRGHPRRTDPQRVPLARRTRARPAVPVQPRSLTAFDMSGDGPRLRVFNLTPSASQELLHEPPD